MEIKTGYKMISLVLKKEDLIINLRGGWGINRCGNKGKRSDM